MMTTSLIHLAMTGTRIGMKECLHAEAALHGVTVEAAVEEEILQQVLHVTVVHLQAAVHHAVVAEAAGSG